MTYRKGDIIYIVDGTYAQTHLDQFDPSIYGSGPAPYVSTDEQDARVVLERFRKDERLSHCQISEDRVIGFGLNSMIWREVYTAAGGTPPSDLVDVVLGRDGEREYFDRESRSV